MVNRQLISLIFLSLFLFLYRNRTAWEATVLEESNGFPRWNSFGELFHS